MTELKLSRRYAKAYVTDGTEIVRLLGDVPDEYSELLWDLQRGCDDSFKAGGLEDTSDYVVFTNYGDRVAAVIRPDDSIPPKLYVTRFDVTRYDRKA
jgi:hypothetical protein